VKDGEKAALSGDRKWLTETGCIIGAGGLRLVLIDTPDYKISQVWRGRLYGSGGDSADVYIRSVDVIGFASGGTFGSEKNAQAALSEMKRRYKRTHKRDSDIPYRIAQFGPEKVKLWIGPDTPAKLDLFCSAASENHETTDEWLLRKKRESEEFSRTLQTVDRPPKLGPRMTCEVPPL
jgi:hypothetical protein